MVELEKIQLFLNDYVDRIDSVLRFFVTHFGHQNAMKLWQQGLIDRIGYFYENGRVEYSFHGAGCLVAFENGELVSFDFLEDDTITFDVYKLEAYINSRMSDSDFQTGLNNKVKLHLENGKWIVKKR